MTVAPKSAPERAASAVPEVQKKADETPAEAKADAVLHSADEADSDWVRLRREVARLEQVMTRASAAEDEQVAPKAPAAMTPDQQAEVPTTTEAQAGAPNHVAAHVLREAFWFEQASAFLSSGDARPTVRDEAPAAPPVVSSVVPPSSTISAQPGLSDAGAEPCAHETTRSSWVTALCLLALIALVAVLTGRELRRFVGGETS